MVALSPAELASMVGVSRPTVYSWLDGKLIKFRRLPSRSGNPYRSIDPIDALRFAEENALPTDALTRYAQRKGLYNPHTQTVLAGTPNQQVQAALQSDYFHAAVAKTWLHFDLLLARSTFDAVIMDSAWCCGSRAEIEERAAWLLTFHPQSLVFVLATAHEAALNFQGVTQVIRQPYTGAKVAGAVWAQLRCRRVKA